jgi:hypothetical protein
MVGGEHEEPWVRQSGWEAEVERMRGLFVKGVRINHSVSGR